MRPAADAANDTGTPAAPLVLMERHDRHVTITLNDPARRNALGVPMFDALSRALHEAEATAAEFAPGATAGTVSRAAPGAITGAPSGALILRLRGAGPAFCAGFDLEACAGAEGQRVLAQLLERLSSAVRGLRRGPWVVVAEVHGAALAGGCALLAACDFVVVSESAKLGYPVHRIGVSPAVNAPLLMATMGAGAARSLLLSGELIDGAEAFRRGLATHVVPETALASTVDELCARLHSKGPIALLETRRWLDRLDGTDRDDRLDAALRASRDLCGTDESVRMLRAFWDSRRS